MSLTEEDVKRIIQQNQPKSSGIDPDQVQWFVRSAFEEGWRMAGGDPATSPHFKDPVGWRAAWMKSSARSILTRNGMISGKDSWK